MNSTISKLGKIETPFTDAEFWRDLLKNQIPRLYRMFMKRWPNPSLAEELTQKTVFDAVRGVGSYDPAKGGPEAWITGIARNVIRMEIRKRANRPIVEGNLASFLEVIDSEPLPDKVLERQETVEAVNEALKRLDHREAQVLKLKYYQDCSALTIARQMNITEKAVHSLLYRARRSLKRTLQQGSVRK